MLVILTIALIVFGPKKLPELAKTIGKAIGEFKKTTEGVKESIGIKELEEIRSNLTGMDLLVDLAEKVSASVTCKELTREASVPLGNFPNGEVLSPVEASVSIGNEKKVRKPENEKLKETKKGTSSNG